MFSPGQFQGDAMQISDGEWEVMRILWEHEPRTAADVIQALASVSEWNHRTIRTMLSRLVEKGALSYEVDGAKYLYRPAVSQADCVRQRSSSFLSKVFNGDASAMVAHFLKDGQLSPQEIAELTRMLKTHSGTKSRSKKS